MMPCRGLRDAFERLAATRVTKSIATGAEATTTGFGPTGNIDRFRDEA